MSNGKQRDLVGGQHGGEAAGGTSSGWKQEASVWQALRRQDVYFCLFHLPKLVSLIPSPSITIVVIFVPHTALSSCIVILSSCVCVSSLPCVVFGSGNWDLYRLFSHSPSNPTVSLTRGGDSYSLSPKLFFVSLSSLSQVKTHIPLERKELETLELLFWAANRGGR